MDCLMVAYAGLIFLIGERYRNGLAMQCYNPLTNEWHRKSSLPISSNNLSKSRIFVRLGQLSVIHQFELTIQIYVYDLAADKWNVSTKND